MVTQLAAAPRLRLAIVPATAQHGIAWHGATHEPVRDATSTALALVQGRRPRQYHKGTPLPRRKQTKKHQVPADIFV